MSEVSRSWHEWEHNSYTTAWATHHITNCAVKEQSEQDEDEKEREVSVQDILFYPLCTQSVDGVDSRVELVKAVNELMASSKAWRGRVCQAESTQPREDKDLYMDMIHGLFKHVLYENRNTAQVSQPGSMEPYRGRHSDQRVIFRLDEECLISPEFYTGKEVRIIPNEAQYSPLKGKLVGCSGRKLEVTLRRFADSSTESQLNLGHIPGRIEPIERDSLERQMELICNQKASHFLNEDIVKYILHDPEIRGHKTDLSNVPVYPFDSEDVLNGIQREVVNWAIRLKGIGLLAGPPGTGKTQTAAELIYELIKQPDGKPVLVVSSSNAAVDVLLARVVQFKSRKDPDMISPGESCVAVVSWVQTI